VLQVPAMSFHRRGVVASLLFTGLLTVAACGDELPAPERVAQVALQVTSVPGDVKCIQVDARAEARTSSKKFTVASGSAAVLALDSLPLGQVTFTALAFEKVCADVDAELGPTWAAPPVTATVRTGRVARVTLTFSRTGSAAGGVVFEDGPVVQLAVGDSFAVALLRDGTVRQWGTLRDQGIPSTPPVRFNQPTPVTGLANVVQVTAGSGFACALLADHTVQCWGIGHLGELGDGVTTFARVTPAPVPGLSGVRQVVAGSHHTCALHDDGTAHCWGLGLDGQLGLGAPGLTIKTTPQLVIGTNRFTQLALGQGHTCAIDTSGQVDCWGRNNVGQSGPALARDAPALATGVRSPGLLDVVQLVAGFDDSCAVGSSGTLRCFGKDGLTTRNPPTAIAGLPDTVAASVRIDVSCAVASDGSLRCWGLGAHGELGNGQLDSSATPVVARIDHVVEVGAGEDHVCALKDNGTVWCWGANDFGQLADATLARALLPRQVVFP
jgi:alpha-tubulin suppressor-like RCC1 family protein